MHLACLSGSEKAVEKILDIGINHPLKPTKDKAGTMQSIHFACRNYVDNPAIINSLLTKYLPFIRKTRKDIKNNGDAAVVALDISDSDGRNSLHLSTLYSNVNVLKEVIKVCKSAPSQTKAYSFFRSTDKHGRTALHYAMFRSNLAAVKLCIEEMKLLLTTKDKLLRSPIHYVSLGTKKKHSEQMDLLTYVYDHLPISQRKSILNQKSIAGYSPFASACKCGNLSAMTFLLFKVKPEDAIDMDAKDLNGIPPIFHCMEAKYSKYHHEDSVLNRVRLIIPFYKSIKDIYGGEDKTNLLMKACQLQLYDIIEYLILNKSNEINLHHIREKDGYTAMHVCAKYGDVQCAGLLLRNGANLLKRDKDGCTPFRLAVGYNQLGVVELFLKYVFNEEENETIGTLFLTENERTHILETPCKQGLTPFLISLTLPSLDMAKLLEYYGCDVKAKTNLGNNALHIAALAGKGEAVSYIDELGLAQSFFRETNKKKKKPFEIASKWENSSVKAEIYKLFVDRSDMQNDNDNKKSSVTSAPLHSSRSNISSKSNASSSNNIVLEQRPLTNFARSYSQQKIKEINEQGNEGRPAKLEERRRKKKLKQKMLKRMPKGNKKFSFNVK